MIFLPKYMGIETKMKLVHRPLNLHYSCTSVLSFTVENNSPNFANNLETLKFNQNNNTVGDFFDQIFE